MTFLESLESESNVLFIFETVDGYKIESVLAKKPMCLCISTHVGCNVGCIFCASCKKGCMRNLGVDELLAQVRYVYNMYGKLNDIHFGGIGEPLNNLDYVIAAKAMLGEVTKTFSITTSIPDTELFERISMTDFDSITVSLHSTRDKTRKNIMPNSLSAKLLIQYLQGLSKSDPSFANKVTLGFLMLEGINDSDDEIREFINLAKELNCTLFPMYYNKIDDNITLKTNEEKYNRTIEFLKANGIKFSRSSSSRRDAIGGCGTLRLNREVRQF